MAKVKSSDTLSLVKSKQKKVVKQTKQLKKKILGGKITLKRPGTVKTSTEHKRGLIYVGHIPHGFYEDEMKKYFKQFGAVTNVKLCRSNRSGNSKGFGYVEFSYPEVAKIAAETMNNYLMFKKRIVAEYIPPEKRPKGIFKGKINSIENYSSKIRADKQRMANMKVNKDTHLRRSQARLSRLNKKLQKLKNTGIDYDFKPTNLPEKLEKKIEEKREVTHEFKQDPYDSDIELKVPLKRRSESAKKTVTKTLKKTPVKSRRSPRRIKQSTQQVQESPKHIKQIPKQVKESPKHIKQSPKHFKQNLKHIKQSPKRVKESPKRIKQSPKRIKKSPKQVKESPKHIEQNPKQVKQSSKQKLLRRKSERKRLV